MRQRRAGDRERRAIAAGLTACALLVAGPAVADAGERAAFATWCASCHGELGRGDGPRASDLERPPADLAGLASRSELAPRPVRLAFILGRDGRSVGPCHDRSLAWMTPSVGRSVFLRGVGELALRYAETLARSPDPRPVTRAP